MYFCLYLRSEDLRKEAECDRLHILTALCPHQSKGFGVQKTEVVPTSTWDTDWGRWEEETAEHLWGLLPWCMVLGLGWHSWCHGRFRNVLCWPIRGCTWILPSVFRTQYQLLACSHPHYVLVRNMAKEHQCAIAKWEVRECHSRQESEWRSAGILLMTKESAALVPRAG